MDLPGKVVLSAEHIVRLLRIKQVGKTVIRKLHELIPVSQKVTEAILLDLLLQHANSLGIPGITRSEILAGFQKGTMLLAENHQLNINIISYFDQAYPLLLKKIESPPLILNVLGNSRLLTLPSIALIGSRKPSAYGKLITQQFASQLATHNLNVVTGLESGCNIVAAKTCVENGGKVIIVLPTGLDTISSKEYRTLADNLIENGCCIVSEYMLRSKELSPFFSNRMRLVAALVQSVVIVETDIEGETMKLASTANSYDRKLFAFDHPMDKLNDKSRGNQLLISQGDAVGIRAIIDILS